MENPVIQISPKTSLALDGSIRKWTKIVKNVTKGRPPDDHGAADCPLCALFNPVIQPAVPHHKSCRGCPVATDAGVSFCKNTPYQNWLQDYDEDDGGGETPENAQAMLDYLVALKAKCGVV